MSNLASYYYNDHVLAFDYDANGNLAGRDIAYPNGGGTNEAWAYGYDADDRMVSVVKDASTVVEYGYDALGRRAWAKEPGSAAEAYFYDSEDRLQTRRGSTIVETVLHGPGIDDYIGARDSGGVVRYMLTDGLGSVTERTSQAGSLTWRAEYEPFGAASAVYDPGGIGAGGYGYTGRVNDSDTGLMYYRSRYYSPEMRRFTQEDRWSGKLHLPDTYITKYAYALNDPILFTDPLGQFVGMMYSRSTGVLFAKDFSTGESVILTAASGDPTLPYTSTGGPIPKGAYEILDQAQHPEYWRLDALDMAPRNDTHDPTGRNRLRLHYFGQQGERNVSSKMRHALPEFSVATCLFPPVSPEG